MSKLCHFSAEEEQAIKLAIVESKIFMLDYGKPPKLPLPPRTPILIEEETETENSNEEDNENQIQETD